MDLIGIPVCMLLCHPCCGFREEWHSPSSQKQTTSKTTYICNASTVYHRPYHIMQWYLHYLSWIRLAYPIIIWYTHLYHKHITHAHITGSNPHHQHRRVCLPVASSLILSHRCRTLKEFTDPAPGRKTCSANGIIRRHQVMAAHRSCYRDVNHENPKCVSMCVFLDVNLMCVEGY